jgi:Protein of unknown function (DUF1501)
MKKLNEFTGSVDHALNRRELLLASALSYGSLSLRSLITGLPIAFLMGKSEDTWAAAANAKFLILSHMSNGDPLNTNAPGTYGNPANAADPLHQIGHPTVAELGAKAQGFETPSTFTLGGKQVRAATPWAGLPSQLLARSAFWHHATYTNAHTDDGVVLSLGGALKGYSGVGTDHLGSFIAQENSANLSTVSSELMRIGGTPTNSNGTPATLLLPSKLNSVFTAKVAQFDRMVGMRDQFIDKTYADIKANGTPAQKKFMDRYATSKQEAAVLGDQLADLIVDIKTNAPADQARMAAALIQLKVSPVITMGIPFGGDNHQDIDLLAEVDQTILAMNTLTVLWDKLSEFGIQNDVVFANFNVFGRTLVRSNNGGRGHNGGHHCMYVFGSSIKPGVVGGLESFQRLSGGIEFKAKPINSATGLASATTDIPYEQTLTSVGKTLAAAVGVDTARIEARIDGGKVISGALL